MGSTPCGMKVKDIQRWACPSTSMSEMVQDSCTDADLSTLSSTYHGCDLDLTTCEEMSMTDVTDEECKDSRVHR